MPPRKKSNSNDAYAYSSKGLRQGVGKRYGCVNCRKTIYWNADMMVFFHDHNGSTYCLGTVGPMASPIIQAVKDGKAILALFDRQTPAEQDMMVSVLRAKSWSRPVGAIPVNKWEAEYLYNQIEAEITWLSNQTPHDDNSKRELDRLHHLARKVKRVWKQPGMRDK